jgi:flagellar hook protein FlgE
MDLIGIVVEIHDKRLYSYDGRSPGDITVKWSNGKTETLPQIYLEKVQNE